MTLERQMLYDAICRVYKRYGFELVCNKGKNLYTCLIEESTELGTITVFINPSIPNVKDHFSAIIKKVEEECTMMEYVILKEGYFYDYYFITIKKYYERERIIERTHNLDSDLER